MTKIVWARVVVVGPEVVVVSPGSDTSVELAPPSPVEQPTATTNIRTASDGARLRTPLHRHPN